MSVQNRKKIKQKKKKKNDFAGVLVEHFDA
jgi:hypothetical protein